MDINAEYKSAIEFTNHHYENFPVISFLLPEDKIPHIAIIYKFARIADDIADKNIFAKSEKIEELKKIETSLIKTLTGKEVDQFYDAILNTISSFDLTAKYFFDLLSAFKYDVDFKGFNSFPELEKYCKHSANPVGRLILEIFDVRLNKAMKFSDKITTALQITNFLQDVKNDAIIGRIYFPYDEMQKFGVSVKQILENKFDENFKNLMKFSLQRVENLFFEGINLIRYLPPELKFHIKLTIAGGLEILNKIKKQNYNTLEGRPVITKTDVLKIIIISLFKKYE